MALKGPEHLADGPNPISGIINQGLVTDANVSRKV
jgi:hypothetical protein